MFGGTCCQRRGAHQVSQGRGRLEAAPSQRARVVQAGRQAAVSQPPLVLQPAQSAGPCLHARPGLPHRRQPLVARTPCPAATPACRPPRRQGWPSRWWRLQRSTAPTWSWSAAAAWAPSSLPSCRLSAWAVCRVRAACAPPVGPLPSRQPCCPARAHVAAGHAWMQPARPPLLLSP